MKNQKPRKTRSPARIGKAGRGSTGALSKDIQSLIGTQLRAMHDDIVKQGVPDRFVHLLARLDAPRDDKQE